MIDRILQIPELSIQRVLEPSCGSCEIIAHLLRSIDPTQHIDIIGIEKNTQIYDQIQHIFTDDPRVSLLHRDFLQWDTMNEHKFDLIIGNPPYFVVSKDSVDETFYPLLDGRPNIFVLFLIHSLQKLRDGGVLAFVLPHNFINCLYYSKIRNHIHNNFAIIDIIDCMDESFLDTKQDTFIVILQKKSDKNKKSGISKKYPNAKEVDLTKNGVTDTWLLDENKDGNYEKALMDFNEDGIIEAVAYDENENDNYEMIVFDDDLDGNPDRAEYDENDDGTMDVVAYDYNQDGEWDKFEELS